MNNGGPGLILLKIRERIGSRPLLVLLQRCVLRLATNSTLVTKHSDARDKRIEDKKRYADQCLHDNNKTIMGLGRAHDDDGGSSWSRQLLVLFQKI